MGDIVISSYELFKKDLLKNTLLLCFVVVLPILSYNSIQKSMKIEELNKINDNLIEKQLKSKDDYLSNHKNWKFLFEKDIYELYKSNIRLKDHILFSSEEFYDISNDIISKFTVSEHNLKTSISKIVYNHVHGEFLVNPLNYVQILYEIDTCFRKMGYLVQDKIMNDLLLKYNGINYPYYSPGNSALNKILKENGKLPLTCDIEILKKFSNKTCIENLHHSRFDIKRFE